MDYCKNSNYFLETERLVLREFNQNDFSDLCLIIQDEETMYAYEHALSDEEAHLWLDRQIERYRKDGFGLWAVILKETGEFIGQCGISMQDCMGTMVPEIGYLFRKNHWGHGYATEAAIACKQYAFSQLGASEIYSIIRDTNLASQRVAIRNGMKKRGSFTKHYHGIDMLHDIFSCKKS